MRSPRSALRRLPRRAAAQRSGTPREYGKAKGTRPADECLAWRDLSVPLASLGGGGRQTLQAECDLELLQWTESDSGARRLPGREHSDGGDAHDPVVHRRVRVGIDVELHDLHLARVLRGELVDLR